MEKFIDRHNAGIVLAKHLKDYENQLNVIVLALPRGGVPVAYEIAKTLSVPLDIFVVRKLGVPNHEELAMGAIASGGTLIFNKPLISQLNLDQASIDAVIKSEQKELVRRERLYRKHRPFPELSGKTIILVDDGIATGYTMRAAVEALRKYNPASIIIAVPVAARETYDEMATLVEKIICPLKPMDFYSVGLWYEQFSQTADSEVNELLEKSNAGRKAPR
jgi:putative phosphoribosyl transferase